jgi:hypothetical protein
MYETRRILGAQLPTSLCFFKLSHARCCLSCSPLFTPPCPPGPARTMASSSASSLHNGHNGHVSNGVPEGKPPRPRVGSLSALNKVGL